MTSFLALIKKEAIEQIRTRKLIILAFVFLIFGIMNPIIAKMTPWLLDVLSDSLAESGMIIEQATVTSLDAWVQFYKNIPMCLIVFVLLESGILTSEIKSSAIVLSLTKGLRRSKVILSKSIILASLWTVCYWLYSVQANQTKMRR